MRRITIRATVARAAMAVAGAGALVLGVATTPANAEVLSATMRCESGAATFICDLTISGVTAPYSVVWTPIKNAGFTHAAGQFARGGCNVGQTFTVQAVVHDSVGQSLTKQGGGLCRRIWQ